MAYPGFQREGCLRSGPIQKVGGGGGALQVRYTKSGGGGGGGGGEPFRFRSDTFEYTENIYMIGCPVSGSQMVGIDSRDKHMSSPPLVITLKSTKLHT